VMVQSERFPIYAEQAQRLADRGLLFPCFCSRSETLDHAIGADPDGAPLYGGTCRHLSETEVAERLERGDSVQYRLKSDAAVALTGPLSFTVAGPTPLDRPQIRYARPQLWGDVIIQRKGTPTSYHLSVVVDDAAQAITHVTRGRDMEPSTDIHVLLQMLLGLEQPIYSFHKLILGEDGRKLSKSKGSPTLRGLSEEGWSAADVRAFLGFD
jgi:glutamyl-Q tRNA(Asp) synthetase